jgi:elongation factor G
MSDVRNVAIVGPSLSGKTTLLESMLFVSGAIGRKGTVKDGNTVGDSAPEARARQMSTEVSAARATFDGVTFNFLDCPGSIEFQAETRNALIGCDAAIVVYEPVIERAMTLAPIFKFLNDNNIPHIVFINKMDRTSTLMRDLIPAMQDVCDKPLVINQVPVRDGEDVVGYVDLITEKTYLYKRGAASAETEMPDSVKEREHEARTMMLETLADFDDTLLEKLLEDEMPSTDEIITDLHDTLGEGALVPVLIGAAELENGVRRLLQHMAEWTPDADMTAEHRAIGDGEPAAQVLKTFHTQHGGKLSLVRVWRGTIKDGDTVNGERIGGVYHMTGAQQDKIDKAESGDIVAFGRLDDARTGDTLVVGGTAPSASDELARAEATPRLYGLAIHAEHRDDEVKLSAALQKIQDEDPSVIAENDKDINQLILWGQGDIHLNVAFEKLKNRYGVGVSAERPRVPYREAIRKPVTQHGRFKRQTGGSGMFGDVHVNIKPLARGAGFEFVNAITGGSVPKQYIPAVEAGVREYLDRGPLGFPVVDLSVELFDGKYHDVDSNEMAFKLAARAAMNEGMPQCNPILLEPISEVHIHTPNSATSKVQQLVTGRRGQLLGFEVRDGWKGWDTVTAHMPQAEIQDLIAELRSLSQGVASFTAAYDHLQELSGRVADQVVEDRKDQLKAA